MTVKSRKKLVVKMKRAFKDAVRAKKRHQKAVVAHRKLVKRFRAA